jgi:hypothetical protein
MKRHSVVTGLAVVAGALATFGCSMLGYQMGRRLDERPPRPAAVWELVSLDLGRELVVHLRNGRSIAGKLAAVDRRPTAAYSERYAAARSTRPEGIDVPALGPATWLDLAGDRHEAQFAGLDRDGPLLEMGDRREVVPFSKVALLRDAEQREITGPVLERLVESHSLPMLTSIRLGRDVEPILLDDVYQAEVYPKGGNATTGLVIGAVADAALLLALVLRDDAPPPPPPSYSCPFAYSFDGATWRREAELFGGATLAAAQQTDRVRLDHLAASGGRYRVRLRDELDEVDHVDALKLVVVDAADDVRVVADPGGALLSVSRPVSPLRAADARGRAVTPALAASDGYFWISDPWGREPEREADRRDGVEVVFDRPDGADAVTLVVNARSTPWAVHMLAELLGLHGPGLTAWRARMNADAVARGDFLRAIAREGLPHVQVNDGTGWRSAGVLRNLGPVVAREQALRIPLAGGAHGELRVRIGATPGFWALDSVLADFAAPRALSTRVLAPIEARAGSRDVADLLARVDGSHLVLRRGESADVAFAALPDEPPPGARRSFLIEASGYYTPLVDTGSLDRSALFQELVDEPGAFARFNLERLAQDLQLASAEARRGSASDRSPLR